MPTVTGLDPRTSAAMSATGQRADPRNRSHQRHVVADLGGALGKNAPEGVTPLHAQKIGRQSRWRLGEIRQRCPQHAMDKQDIGHRESIASDPRPGRYLLRDLLQRARILPQEASKTLGERRICGRTREWRAASQSGPSSSSRIRWDRVSCRARARVPAGWVRPPCLSARYCTVAMGSVRISPSSIITGTLLARSLARESSVGGLPGLWS
jgi:hypothetical protein